MPRREYITIQDPPVQELRKRSRYVKRVCLSGCGCLVLFLMGSLLFLRFISAPRSIDFAEKIPSNLSSTIALYDEGQITDIRYTSGKEKHPILETAALIPKVILSPLILSIDEQYKPEGNTWEAFRDLIEKPLISESDTYDIFWTDLTTDRAYLVDFYENDAKKKGWTLEKQTGSDQTTMIFSGEGASGSIHIFKKPDGRTTLRMTINIVREYANENNDE